MQAVFRSKNKGFLTFTIGNASRVILPREMVYPVLINTAANRVTHNDRRLPNNLVTIALWLSIRTSTWQMISAITSSIYIITDPIGSSSSSSGPYLFWCAEPYLPHYNPSQIFPLPFMPHLSPSTSSETYT